MINAPKDDMVLRGLSICGTKSVAACPFIAGSFGVKIVDARSVSIEDSTIYNADTAILVAPGRATPR